MVNKLQNKKSHNITRLMIMQSLIEDYYDENNNPLEINGGNIYESQLNSANTTLILATDDLECGVLEAEGELET